MSVPETDSDSQDIEISFDWVDIITFLLLAIIPIYYLKLKQKRAKEAANNVALLNKKSQKSSVQSGNGTITTTPQR